MKNKFKLLQTHLKKGGVVFLFFAIHACLPTCNDKELAVIEAAENGDVEAVKAYFENRGDPMLECHNTAGGKFGSTKWLYFSVCKSESLPLIKYYLSQNISDEIKNKMLYYYSDVKDDNIDIVKLLIDNKAKIVEYVESCIYSKNTLSRYNKFNKVNYNFNWIDPKDGNTILMKYVKCPANENEDELLDLIKYLVKIGVKTDIKNNEGKTAYEIAVNEKVKEYLKKK